MSDTWERLLRLCERTAPHLPRGGLNPPATEEQLRAVERVIGHDFAPDLREAYLHFNGARGMGGVDAAPGLILHAGHWLDLEQVLSVWLMDRNIYEHTDLATPEVLADPGDRFVRRPDHRARIPVGRSNTSWRMYIDMQPGPAGIRGQLLSFVDEDGEPRWEAPSFVEYVDLFLDAVDAGVLVPDSEGVCWLLTTPPVRDEDEMDAWHDADSAEGGELEECWSVRDLQAGLGRSPW